MGSEAPVITKLMHTVNAREHIAQHASAAWLERLRNDQDFSEPVLDAHGTIIGQRKAPASFQCIGCSAIVHSADVTNGETYE